MGIHSDLAPGSTITISDAPPAYGATLQRPGQSITVSPEVAELLWGETGG